MVAPALASVSELSDRLGRVLHDGERAQADAALQDASALVREEGNSSWTADTVPQAVVAVVLTAALRVMRNPDGFTSETIGAYTYRRRDDDIGVYLSDAEKAIVRRYRAQGGRQLWTQSTTRGEGGDDVTLWATTVPYGADPFPLDDARDFGWYGR